MRQRHPTASSYRTLGITKYECVESRKVDIGHPIVAKNRVQYQKKKARADQIKRGRCPMIVSCASAISRLLRTCKAKRKPRTERSATTFPARTPCTCGVPQSRKFAPSGVFGVNCNQQVAWDQWTSGVRIPPAPPNFTHFSGRSPF